ncbi:MULTISPECIES: enoyl-CoA hydratase/isomerase family protein [Micrococcaceae]|uniref:enoyl-CoA hydratase/isomerase family protein n=1 Tax=Micrococcaceae TaxID=1268 RepID=UPI00063DDA5A|nr:enoyl-CoA hydratase/isomerase family protein [Arthrobacter sp. YC-RL1]ALQ29303.1 enoyl-CoA hydratase [Arthrobacter sp. YC-RL1]KLI89302.1 enoyl-CoA hydratase [Arthrobacter sp. YC-RL1]
MPSLRLIGTTAVLDLGADQNRQGVIWLQEVNDLLDEVLASPATSLVTTGTGKFYSNGLDVAEAEGPVELDPDYVRQLQAVYRRVLTLPMPTAAAVNGHAFGGGALLAMAHDYRVMRTERGFFCFPEVNIGIAFTEGMAALVQSKLSAAQARDAMLTGRRFDGDQAAAAGLVDEAVPVDQLVERAVQLASAHVPAHPQTLGAVKEIMYADAASALERGHRPAGALAG